MKTQREVRDPGRTFRDGHGTPWRVREVDASELRSPQGHHCLIFTCDNASRRVWRFPAHWRDLGEEELEKLSWER